MTFTVTFTNIFVKYTDQICVADIQPFHQVGQLILYVIFTMNSPNIKTNNKYYKISKRHKSTCTNWELRNNGDKLTLSLPSTVCLRTTYTTHSGVSSYLEKMMLGLGSGKCIRLEISAFPIRLELNSPPESPLFLLANNTHCSVLASFRNTLTSSHWNTYRYKTKPHVNESSTLQMEYFWYRFFNSRVKSVYIFTRCGLVSPIFFQMYMISTASL